MTEFEGFIVKSSCFLKNETCETIIRWFKDACNKYNVKDVFRRFIS